MLNLYRIWKDLSSDFPVRNDPHLQETTVQDLWHRYLYVSLGRGIMAWLAIAGWLIVVFLVMQE